MDLIFATGDIISREVGTQLVGIRRDGRRPIKISLEASDLLKLTALPPERMKTYLEVLRTCLA